MKKILMGTTAIVALATFSSQAVAADPIAVSVGGFSNFMVGLANDQDAANLVSDLGMSHDSEIHVKGSTTLDNGVSVGVTIELETGSNPGTASGGTGDLDSVDRNYITISSDAMGALVLGETNHAADAMAVGAPMTGPVGFGDAWDWASTDQTTTTGAGNGTGNFSNDTIKFKYISPDFSGVSVGVSYTIGSFANEPSAGQLSPYSATQDQASLALAYSGEMSGAAVDVSVVNHFAQDNLTTTAFGVNVGMNGFTVGGNYETQEDNTQANGLTTSPLDGTAYSVGVAYETGAMTVSASYLDSEADGAVGGGSNETTEWVLGVSYDLGAGVGLAASYYDAENKAENAGQTQSVSGIVAGIEVSF